MTNEAYKDATHDTNKDSHLHVGDEIIFTKDNFSTKEKRTLTKTEIETKELAVKALG